jgi:hypothetical protein
MLRNATAFVPLMGLQFSTIATLVVYWLFLILSRPYDDTIFQTFEIITSTGQLAMMIVVMLGFYGIIEAPTGAFIGIIAVILLGQVGNQVCSDATPMDVTDG